MAEKFRFKTRPHKPAPDDAPQEAPATSESGAGTETEVRAEIRAEAGAEAENAQAPVPGESVPAQVSDEQVKAIAKKTHYSKATIRATLENPEPEQPAPEQLNFEGVPSEPKKPRGRNAASYIAAASKKQRQQQASQTALVILTIVDGMVGTLLDPECVMTKAEREMIEPPLTRILERVDPVASAVIERYTDPILLGMGILLWGLRVWNVEVAKMEAARKPPANRLEPAPVANPAQPAPVSTGESATRPYNGNLGDSSLIATLAEMGQ